MLPVAADGTCRAPENSAKTNRMKQHAKRVIAFYLPQYHPFPENDPVVGRRDSRSGATW